MRELPGFLIGGRVVAAVGSEFQELVSPSTGQVYGRIPVASSEDIDRAVRAAREAFDDGRWSGLSVEERAEILLRAADIIESRADDIAALTPIEAGQGVASARLLAVDAAQGVRRAVAVSRVVPWEESRTGSWDYVLRHEPVGVVGVINPFNGPPWLTAVRIATALAAGCTVVDKPAVEIPFSSLLVAQCFVDAGVPEGVVNSVPGDRPAGEALVAHPGVDKIAFTGSSIAGAKIAASCGERLKIRPLLELGGKSAAIVLEDADLGELRAAIAAGTFWASGQQCVALTRVVAPRSRYDEIVDALVAEAKLWTPGDPMDPEVMLTPLVSARGLAKVADLVAVGIAEGAVVAVGGEQYDRPGFYFQPTVFRDVTPEMRVAREEFFGPVLVVIPYDTEEEAIAIANDSDYGLAGSIFTADADRAMAIAARIQSGTMAINGFTINPDAPLGGFKASGCGVMGGPEGFEEYRKLKTVNVRPGENVMRISANA